MMQRRHIFALLPALAAWGAGRSAPAWAQADGMALLGQFLQQVKSGRAQFTQVVTSTPKNGQAARSRSSSGVLEFMRPGRFRFVYKKPFEQTLVADGQTLWLYDPDLQQATARAQQQALAATPLALITSANHLSALQADFQLSSEPARDGLLWVRATPKRPEGQIQHALVGLRAPEVGAGAAPHNMPQLAVLEVLDALGQRSVLSFSALEINPSLKADAFVFQPPPGVDVIRP